MSKKHEQNVRYLASAQAYVRIAREALDQAGLAISSLDVGDVGKSALRQSYNHGRPTGVRPAYDDAAHAIRALEVAVGNLIKVVCGG